MRDDLALYQQPPSFAHWQPDAAEASDAYISDANPTTNYGNDVDTRVSQDTNNISLSLFRFDTAAIPAGAKIFDATLSLLRQSGSGIDVPVTAHRIVNPWNEGYVTWERRDNGISWDTQGGDLDPRVVSTTLVGPANNIRYEWELTTLGQGWVDGTYGNFGVALRTEEPGISGERFFTSDHANLAFHPRLTITYACGCAVACAATGGAPVSAKIILSTKSTARLGGLTFTDKDLAEYDPDPDTATLYLDGAAVGVTQDIDAVHVLANGHLVLSTINTVTLAGLTFENEDLVEYDPVADTATMLFDGSTLFSGGSTDVSAVHVTDSGHLVLSNEYDVTLGGLSFEPNDLVDYDPATDTAVLLLDGDAVGLVGWINAVHLLANGHIVLSTEASATLGGLSFNPGDLVDYDPVADTASLHFDGALFSSTEDVRSAHVGDGGGGTAAAAPALWLSTLDDVTSSGAPGLDAWTDGEALEIADPNLALEPGATDGTFSSVFNLDDFAGDADIDAIHYVDNDITVGSSNSVDLLAGDVLLSTDVDETLTSSNSLAVNDEDVFVFRPETLGDYSAGTFIFLIDGSQIHSESDTVGVSLVEKDTTVGDGSLTKGSFILATTSRRDVQLFAADDVGLDRTSGSVTEFIDGPSLSLGSEIRGLDLAEDEVIVGGHTIAAGSILVTLDNDDTGGVGDNMIPVDSADVFYLTVTQTGASPIADAVLLFEGLDVSLDTSQEHVQALTLTNATSAGDSGPPPPPADCTYSDNFNNQSYANSDGNAAWGSNWTEEGESTNPTGGDIRVINDASDFQLRVQDDDNKIWRELDLSGGHASATLSFEYRRQSLESNAEYVAVEVSNNGGGSWTEIRGPATEDGYTGVSYDISSYMAANTRIRYVSPSGGMSNGDDVYFDNVKIEAIGGTCP